MTDAEITALNKARAALARRRNAIADSLGDAELAPLKAAEELTRVLLAIEAVDRALADAGRPYMPDPVASQAVPRGRERPVSQSTASSASQAKERAKAAVQADREHQPAR